MRWTDLAGHGSHTSQRSHVEGHTSHLDQRASQLERHIALKEHTTRKEAHPSRSDWLKFGSLHV
jgi:hypothetical protein